MFRPCQIFSHPFRLHTERYRELRDAKKVADIGIHLVHRNNLSLSHYADIYTHTRKHKVIPAMDLLSSDFYHYTPSQSSFFTDYGSFLYLEASPKTEHKHTKLLSPVVGPEEGPLCLLFRYQLSGVAKGRLQVLIRNDNQEETLLWTMKTDHDNKWREGRTILPQSPKEYQVRRQSLSGPPSES